jgi:hypothetical protein
VCSRKGPILCECLPVVPSPQPNGYRNKSEFAINTNANANATATAGAATDSAASAGGGDASKSVPMDTSTDVKSASGSGPGSVASAAVVGFTASKFREGGAGAFTVVPVDPLKGAPHLPTVSVSLAALLQAFVRTQPFACFDRQTHRGVWRLLTVR